MVDTASTSGFFAATRSGLGGARPPDGLVAFRAPSGEAFPKPQFPPGLVGWRERGAAATRPAPERFMLGELLARSVGLEGDATRAAKRAFVISMKASVRFAAVCWRWPHLSFMHRKFYLPLKVAAELAPKPGPRVLPAYGRERASEGGVEDPRL